MVGSGQLDAVVLAVAGLVRIGYADAISQAFEIDQKVPAPGRRALAVECLARKPQLAPLLGMVSDPATAAAVTAERSLLEVLGAGCNAPVGAYAAGAGQLRMQAAVISGDGRRVLRAYRAAPADAAWRLGRDLGAELLHRGPAELPSHSGLPAHSSTDGYLGSGSLCSAARHRRTQTRTAGRSRQAGPAEPAVLRHDRVAVQPAQVRGKVCKVPPAVPGFVSWAWCGGAGRGRGCRRGSGLGAPGDVTHSSRMRGHGAPRPWTGSWTGARDNPAR